MAKIKVMRKNVKVRYASEGKDRCTGCNQAVEVGDEYTTTGQTGGKRHLLYCRVCAEEKCII